MTTLILVIVLVAVAACGAYDTTVTKHNIQREQPYDKPRK